MLGRVGAREADSLRGGEGAGARDVDLGAGLVELSLVGLVGAVQSQDLNAQEIVAGGDALGDVEVDPAVVLDQVVDTPLLAAGVKGVLPDLEPVSILSAILSWPPVTGN